MKLHRPTGIYIFIFAVFVLLPISTAYSQHYTQKLEKPDIARCFKKTLKTEFGIKGGLTISSFSGDQYVLAKNLRLGYNFGVFARIPITKAFFVQPELLHTTKGARIIYKIGEDMKGEYAVDLNYIEAPVGIAFRLDPALHIYAGGYFSYLVSADSRALWQDDESPGIADLTRDDFQTFDFGVLGGIAVDVQKITLGMRYSSGLRGIGKPQAGLIRNLSNNALSVYVSFII